MNQNGIVRLFLSLSCSTFREIGANGKKTNNQTNKQKKPANYLEAGALFSFSSTSCKALLMASSWSLTSSAASFGSCASSAAEVFEPISTTLPLARGTAMVGCSSRPDSVV